LRSGWFCYFHYSNTLAKAVWQTPREQDPAAERREAIAKASDAPLGTVVDRFLTRQERRLRPSGYSATKRYLKELWKPLHALHLTNISRADVAARLGGIAGENGPIAADRTRAAFSAFFTWAIREGLCEINPVVGTNKAAELKSRKRVLTDEELKIIWQAAPESDYGRIVRLLILTGQRREEIGGLRWPEVDTAKRVIRLPGDRTKNHRDHNVPLTKAALAILNAQPVRAGREFVFGDGPRSSAQDDEAPAGGGFQGWSKSKNALDKKTKGIQAWRTISAERWRPAWVISACTRTSSKLCLITSRVTRQAWPASIIERHTRLRKLPR
jgi:integrase